jgi:hypothetical protein
MSRGHGTSPLGGSTSLFLTSQTMGMSQVLSWRLAPFEKRRCMHLICVNKVANRPHRCRETTDRLRTLVSHVSHYDPSPSEMITKLLR